MKILVVVARRYNGHELWTALGVLQQADIDFEVVSTNTIIADEITGRPNKIERTLDEVDSLEGFDGLMIVSGNMDDTEAYWYDPRVQKLVQQARMLPTAAICCSVPTIRHIAKGRKVSFFPLIRSRLLLEEAGAIPQTVSVTVDGNLVTAEHQMATQLWAEMFVKVLKGEPADPKLQDSGFTPKGGLERRLHPTLERIRGKGYHPKNIQLMEGKISDHNQ